MTQTSAVTTPALGELVVETSDADLILERFLGWVKSQSLALYPAQEEAILELMSGKHVILNTPTGSGKSLVALALHFKTICEGGRSFYTAPLKALASEKFFALCRDLGAQRVGMLTGDASVNAKAPVVCCTAEILANLSLRQGRYTPADSVVMDEFHYYGDPDRGVAWQLPLIVLADATFLLMSATLGDMRDTSARLEQRTDKTVAIVRSHERPVPLDFEYRETLLPRTLRDLTEQEKTPIYLVHFTQREAAEGAQDLMSVDLCTKEHKGRLAEAIGAFRFDTPFGKQMRRFVRHGVGLHHAGLLPKYRLLVEKLAQRGLLKVICGTDTLGAGVNLPIRTVLFTRLSKFDGEKARILSARDFKQIAGRAGRQGFDTRGSVVGQAPEHVIENKELAAKDKKKPKKKPPRGFVPYDRKTFERLVGSEPEPLVSQFAVTHGMLMNILSRELAHGERHGGYRRLMEIITHSHEREGAKHHHRKTAATLCRALRQVGVIEIVRPEWDARPYLRLAPGLQRDFSLHHTLSLYLVEALAQLDPAQATYPLDLLSLVEAVQESPRVILERQIDKLKGELVAKLKAEGVDYADRMTALEEVTHPKPNAESIYETFDAFRAKHPWVREENVRPKSIARDMVERYASFGGYVVDYGLERSEGVLLRYLSETYKTVVQTVPDALKSEGVYDILAYLRTLIEHADASLVSEWERMLTAEPKVDAPATAPAAIDWSHDPRAFARRVRAELHQLVRFLSVRDYEGAAAMLCEPEGAEPWTPARLDAALSEFYAAHARIVFDHRARLADLTHIKELAPGHWLVQQTLVDPESENLWMVEAEIDHRESSEGPWLRLARIGA